jgi:hypothetical protein
LPVDTKDEIPMSCTTPIRMKDYDHITGDENLRKEFLISALRFHLNFRLLSFGLLFANILLSFVFAADSSQAGHHGSSRSIVTQPDSEDDSNALR